MKKFYLIIVLIFNIIVSSCANTTYVTNSSSVYSDDTAYILNTYYPQLYQYYNDGVLDITSIEKVMLDDSIVDYKVNYKFVRYYYNDYQARLDALRIYYPELYQMYINGVIDITMLYRYVDRTTGRIRHHISYRRLPSYRRYYYNPYTRVRVYHPVKPAPQPHHRPQHSPAPKPKMTPNHNNPGHVSRPANRPNVAPSHNSHTSRPANRPNNSPSRRSSGQSSSRNMRNR